MRVNPKKPVRRELMGALAAVLALSLAACDQKPSAEKIGKQIDESVEKANRRIEKAAATAEKKIDQAAAAVRETTADAREAARESASDAAKAIRETSTDAGKVIGDAALTAKVKAALIAEPGLKALAIDVDSVDGVVTLNGTVDNPANRDKAVQVVTGVQGVKSVKNNLAVKTS